MPITIANNYYENVTILPDKKIFYVFTENSNITITNETLLGSNINDLYTIGAVNNLIVKDFSISSINNTDAITETSAILKISKSNGKILI